MDGKAVVPKMTSELSPADQLKTMVMPENPLSLWHKHLGHIGEVRLKDVISKHLVTGMDCKLTSTAQLYMARIDKGGKNKITFCLHLL